MGWVRRVVQAAPLAAVPSALREGGPPTWEKEGKEGKGGTGTHNSPRTNPSRVQEPTA